MRYCTYRLLTLLLLIFSSLTLSDCRSKPSDSQQETRVDYGQQQNDPAYSKNHRRSKHHHSKHQRQRSDSLTGQTQPDQRAQLGQKGAIPQKVFDVLSYVRKNGRAMDGYVGGRRFGNFENRLPKNTSSGQAIQYQEWDVNPKVQGKNRGTERLITGSDNRAYYTNDHYNSFTEVK